MATLKEINQDVAGALDRLQDVIDEETGEITDLAYLAELEELQMAREEKLQNIIRWIISRRAELKAIKEEKARLDKRLKAGTREIDFLLSRYLPAQMGEGETYHCADGDIRYRHSRGVVITDADELPGEYVRMIREVNKAEMLKALKAGAVIPGAELEERTKLVVV